MRKSKHSFTGTHYFEEERADTKLGKHQRARGAMAREANGSYDIAQRRTTAAHRGDSVSAHASHETMSGRLYS